MAADRTDDPRPDTARESERSEPSRRPGRFTILRRAWADAKQDRLPLVAAGVAFYAFLAIVPTLIATVLVYGLVSDPEDVTSQIQEYASALPSGAQELLSEQMTTLAQASQQTLGIGLIIALAVALWSASTGTSNLITAVNLAYDGDESRGFIKSRALALLFTIGAILMFLIAIALVATVPAILGAVDLPQWARWLVEAGRWIVLVFVVLTALAVLYRWAPERPAPKFKFLTPGAVIATIIWIAASVGFSIYVDNFGSYAETYGSLAGVVVLMLWLWLSALATLLGAEINAEVEKTTPDAELYPDDNDARVRRTDDSRADAPPAESPPARQ
jgi:membrane protein